MDQPQLTDDLLAKRIQTGDEEALAILFDRYESVFASIISREIGNTADAPDVLQEIHLAIWKSIGSFEEGRSLKAWMSKIARNKCADYRRSTQRRLTPIPDETLAPLVDALTMTEVNLDALTEIELDALRQEVREAVADLSPIYREVTELHYFKSWSIREIAEDKNLKSGTVKRRLHEARNRLRRHSA